LKVREFPNVDFEKLRSSRLTPLVQQAHKNPLAALTEIRFYHARGMITEPVLLTAYGLVLAGGSGANEEAKKAAAEDAKKLASGTEEERKAVISQWLPAANATATTPSSDGGVKILQ
jgi:hypothetical protein